MNTNEKRTGDKLRHAEALSKSCRGCMPNVLVVLLVLLSPTWAWGQTTITSLSDISSDLTGNYIIAADIDASGTTITGTFSGTLEAAINPATHMPYRIKSLTAPLFETVSGTVKNLVIETVSISGHSGYTGAIACTANGAARIYNVGILGGSVGGTTYTGGLVGFLDGTARVVNCYSYANITGGTSVGGIVGYNNYATTSTLANLKTMVYCCMFYGEISGGTSKAPIYNGNSIVNMGSSGVGNFNYFLSERSYVKNRQINKYNCALMAEARFLQRFEFFRQLLNSHRETSAWWVSGNRTDTVLIMKWVMTPDSIGSGHPYPVLKKWGKYPSVVNYDAASAQENQPRNQGGKLGTLKVHIQMGSGGAQFGPPTDATITTEDTALIITDKDTAHFNFNYYKVQLPYYNDVGTKNYRKASDGKSRVVTGWKIVYIHGGTPGSLTTGSDAAFDADGNFTSTPYNFADRHCTAKDLYSNSNKRVFNQGAYWDVPEGVDSIVIEPYWAKAAYVADAYADVVYNNIMETKYDVPNVGGGSIYSNEGDCLIAGELQKVYTSVVNAKNALSVNTSYTVNDYAIVLVGNYHQIGVENSTNPYTITSIDLNGDNEPDYAFILRFNSRTPFHPVKYDFVHLVGFGMAQKSTGSTGSYNFGILQPKNWFEVTNTALFRVTQFEFDRSDRVANKPIILQGGVIEQWVSGQSNGVANNTIYYHVGGNVWFKEFHLGCHQDKDQIKTKHPPISVTGGDFDAFYLTGLYATTINYEDNAECYINGGRFGTMAGTGMEGIGDASAHTNGNIAWKIDNADIKEFFAGGINAAKPAEGNILTVISNSHVDFFYGGPKFGDMNPNRMVITKADSCHFILFYGAGYGGNSYYNAAPGNFTNANSDPWIAGQGGLNLNWNRWIRGEIKGSSVNSGNYPGGITYTGYHNDYIGRFGGVSTAIDYQFLPMSDNKTNVARLFLKFVKFSLATTRSVRSELFKCTIDSNFYGGGSLGKVAGNVVSILDSCTVKGNVFGAGFSATIPPIPVMATGGFATEPVYDTATGVFLQADFPDTIYYTWDSAATVNSTATAINTTTHTLYTTESLSTLGTVTDTATLILKGNTTVGTILPNGSLKSNTGNVYGGGDMSAVKNTDNPSKANTIVILQQGVTVHGNVYGGGNRGAVSGNSTVNIQDPQP